MTQDHKQNSLNVHEAVEEATDQADAIRFAARGGEVLPNDGDGWETISWLAMGLCENLQEISEALHGHSVVPKPEAKTGKIAMPDNVRDEESA